MNQGIWSKTAVGTGSGATATQAAVTGHTYVVTWISGHTDADSTVSITDGTNTLWQIALDVSVEGYKFHCPGLGIPIPISTTAVGVIAASTADCQVTLGGYIL